jgi:hypothetical protein
MSGDETLSPSFQPLLLASGLLDYILIAFAIKLGNNKLLKEALNVEEKKYAYNQKTIIILSNRSAGHAFLCPDFTGIHGAG